MGSIWSKRPHLSNCFHGGRHQKRHLKKKKHTHSVRRQVTSNVLPSDIIGVHVIWLDIASGHALGFSLFDAQMTGALRVTTESRHFHHFIKFAHLLNLSHHGQHCKAMNHVLAFSTVLPRAGSRHERHTLLQVVATSLVARCTDARHDLKSAVGNGTGTLPCLEKKFVFC